MARSLWSALVLLLCVCRAASLAMRGARTLEPDGNETSRGQRLIATVGPQQIRVDSETTFDVWSTVPVFGGGESSVNLLLEYNEKLGQLFEDKSFFCATQDGTHQARIRVKGAGPYEWDKRGMAFQCDWPASLQDQACQHVVIKDEDHAELGTVEGCNDLDLYKETYGLAACVAPIFHEADHPENSGILKLPQWIEYNVMHGVQQFVVYLWPEAEPALHKVLEPYVSAGLVTKVAMDSVPLRTEQSNVATGNDCLYRMKHRTKWLMPFVDSDEYLFFRPGGKREDDFLTGITAVLEEHAKNEEGEGDHDAADADGAVVKPTTAHSISFGRYCFLYPPSPSLDVHLTSFQREAELPHWCAKYITRPELVHTLFNHWPTSWEPSTENVYIWSESMVGFHYRRLVTEASTVEDRTLESDSKTVADKLEARFGSPWASFSAALFPEGNATAKVSFVDSVLSLDELEDEASGAQFPRFVSYVNALKQSQIIEPPLVPDCSRAGGPDSALHHRRLCPVVRSSR